MQTESNIMKILGFLGLVKLRWSLRRLHCPVKKNALVLEIGGGGNPYPRSNVLLDAEEISVERRSIQHRPLVIVLLKITTYTSLSFYSFSRMNILTSQKNSKRTYESWKAGYRNSRLV